MEAKLAPLGFSVTHQKVGDTTSLANEYINCKSDLVVYNPSKCFDAIKVLHILIKTNENFQTLAVLSHCDVGALVSEIKVGAIDEKANNECFFNMFGELVKILLKVLSSGRLIRKVKVFGIAVAAHDHQLAQLLILEIDMDLNTCVFKRGASKAPFTELLNKIISVLTV